MAYSGGTPFMVFGSVTVGALVTQLWEIPNVANRQFEIIQLDITFGTTATAFTTVEFATATAAATVWTSTTPTPYDITGQGRSSNFAPKLWATGTSTNGTGYTARGDWSFNVINGFTHFPVPEGRFSLIAGAGTSFFVVKFAVAPPASTVINTVLVYREI